MNRSFGFGLFSTVLGISLVGGVLPVSYGADQYIGDHPFTAQEAQDIKDGVIVYDDGSDTGLVDASLVNGTLMAPDADDDFDGIPNSQELHVYTKNGKKYLHYLSHPKLADTDGDGLPDKDDPDPLMWNVHARDGVIFQELAYRDDDYIRKVLGQTPSGSPQLVEEAYESTMADLPKADWFKGRQQYPLMRREVAPFWNMTRSWHTGSGFDATLYEFSNKTFPYLKNASTHVLGIRGTAGAKDVAQDALLAIGVWFGQIDDVYKVADEFAAHPEKQKNLYVAGHSLGGHLTQMFMVRSVGKKYGDPSGNPGHKDWNSRDKNKHDNPEVKQAFGFNAARIKCSLFTKSLCEAFDLSAYLDKVYHNKFFQVNNDKVISPIGYPDSAIYIGNSDNGHSSLSFFEPKFKTVEGFSIGKRDDLSGFGYQDPNLAKVRFLKPTTVELKNEGKTVKTFVLAKTQQELKNITKEQLVTDLGDGVVVDGDISLKYGQKNVINGHIKQIKVTYKFVTKTPGVVSGDSSDSPVGEPVVITTPYKTDYQAPSIPKSTDPDYRYELKVKPITKVPVEELTKDQVLTVELIKEPVLLTTTVNFKDGDKVVKTITKETKPSEKPILLASDYPNGYQVPADIPALKAGENNDISVNKQEFTLTFQYVNVKDGDKVVGQSATETVKYGEDSKYQLSIPTGYELATDYSYQSPTAVNSNRTILIKVQPKVAETWQITFVFKHNGKQIGQQINTVKTGDQVELNAPAHPQAADGNKYRINKSFVNPYAVDSQKPASGSEIIDVPVDEQIPAINLKPATQIYTITLNYVYGDKTVKTEVLKLKKDAPIQLTLPTSNAGSYALGDETNLAQTATKDETITVPLKFNANLYTVTLRYVYTDANGQKTLIKETTTQVKYGEKPIVENRIKGEMDGRYYEVKSGYQAPEIQGSVDILVPLTKVVKNYRVEVKYIDKDGSGKQVGTQILEVPAGSVANLSIPKATGFDGQYVLDPSFNNPVIDKEQVLEVPLIRQLNTYQVVVNYTYSDGNKNEVIVSSPQLVTTGASPVNDYATLIANASGEEKAKLQKYQVVDGYDWGQKITKNTTLSVPLKLIERPKPPVAQLKITAGMRQTWQQDSTEGAVFVSNGTYDDTVQVLVDGKVLDPVNYESWSGSVHVKLLPSYLKTLAVGKHTLGIKSKEGIASTEFTITAKKGSESTTSLIDKWVPVTSSSSGNPENLIITENKKSTKTNTYSKSIRALANTGTVGIIATGGALVLLLAGLAITTIRRKNQK